MTSFTQKLVASLARIHKIQIGELEQQTETTRFPVEVWDCTDKDTKEVLELLLVERPNQFGYIYTQLMKCVDMVYPNHSGLKIIDFSLDLEIIECKSPFMNNSLIYNWGNNTYRVDSFVARLEDNELGEYKNVREIVQKQVEEFLGNDADEIEAFYEVISKAFGDGIEFKIELFDKEKGIVIIKVDDKTLYYNIDKKIGYQL